VGHFRGKPADIRAFKERIREILPDLDGMIGGGLITLERAHVILYRPGAPGAD
jgi:PII-like signaling protein